MKRGIQLTNTPVGRMNGNAKRAAQEGVRSAMSRYCRLCGGEGCEYGCALSGKCEHVYAGPDSHKVCRRCMGTGKEPKDL